MSEMLTSSVPYSGPMDRLLTLGCFRTSCLHAGERRELTKSSRKSRTTSSSRKSAFNPSSNLTGQPEPLTRLLHHLMRLFTMKSLFDSGVTTLHGDRPPR